MRSLSISEMKSDNIKKLFQKLKKAYSVCPFRHLLLLISLLIIALFMISRNDRELMIYLSENFISPFHSALAVFNSNFSVSAAELLIIAAVVFAVAVTAWLIARIISGDKKLYRLYSWFMSLFSAACAVYAGFCVLWGVYYYGESFIEKSGLDDGEISVEQLEKVTAYFAGMANEYSYKVNRDTDGVYAADFDGIISKSDRVFENTVEEFPCLSGPDVKVKGFIHSKLLSYTDFTGFFFPFTAEANVNTDVPSAYFASTVAHELSHQRGIAQEQYANFAAVVASLNFGDPDYVYSACLLAYCHLGNALHNADYDKWTAVYETLNENVRADYAAEREYWRQFETPVEAVSNTVYENFLYSYDQDLGLKSYGACVDLLVNYYFSLLNNA